MGSELSTEQQGPVPVLAMNGGLKSGGTNLETRTVRSCTRGDPGSIEEEFDRCVEFVNNLPEPPSTEDKNVLYGLFKQATVGPVNIPRPNKYNTIYWKKWDAWKAVEGKSKEEAMKEYIAKVKELQAAAAQSF